jgi:hypothetical protein
MPLGGLVDLPNWFPVLVDLRKFPSFLCQLIYQIGYIILFINCKITWCHFQLFMRCYIIYYVYVAVNMQQCAIKVKGVKSEDFFSSYL